MSFKYFLFSSDSIDLILLLFKSKTYNIIDDSCIFSNAFSIPIFSILSFVSLRPAVSINLTKFPPIVIVSSITSLVVPGISDIIAFSSLSNELSIVDFPTLGLPNITTLIPSLMTLFNL